MSGTVISGSDAVLNELLDTDKIPVGRVGDARATVVEVGILSEKIKGKGFKNLVSDYGAKGDNATLDTVAINDAIADCMVNKYVLIVPPLIYKTVGGHILNAPIDIIATGATFNLVANDHLFTIQNDSIHIDGCKIRVLNSNTLSVIYINTVFDLTGWAIQDNILRNITLYDSIWWGYWVGIEVNPDTQRGYCFNVWDNITITGASKCIQFSQGTNDTWINSNNFNNLTLISFDTAIYSRINRLTGNNFSGLMIEATKPISSVGLDILNGDCNEFEVVMWDDGAVDNSFTSWIFGTNTIRNKVSGYVEDTASSDSGTNDYDYRRLRRWADTLSVIKSVKGTVSYNGKQQVTSECLVTEDGILANGNTQTVNIKSDTVPYTGIIRGIWNRVINLSGFACSYLRGLDFSIDHTTSTTVGSMEGIVSVVANTGHGTVTEGKAFSASPYNSGFGTIGTYYGYFSGAVPAAATVGYHFYGYGNYPSYFGGLVESAVGFKGDGSQLTNLPAVHNSSGAVNTIQLSDGSGGFTSVNGVTMASNGTIYTSDISLSNPVNLIVNDLTHTDTNKALSAAQGKVLSDRSPVLTTGYVAFSDGTKYTGDSALFWDNTNKYLGVGTTSPITPVDVYRNTNMTVAVTFRSEYNSPTLGGILNLRHSTSANAYCNSGDRLGSVQFGSRSGTVNRNGAQITAYAVEAFSDTNAGGELSIRTTTIGTNTPSEKLRISSQGFLGITLGSTVGASTTITPTGPIFHVSISGPTTIQTINVPYTGFIGQITIIPDGAFTTGTTGNIALASTAVINKALIMTYDGTKWYPSY